MVACTMANLSEVIAREASAAAAKIRGIVCETPLERSAALSDATGAEVFVKLENLQHTGSFKLRGACHCLLSLDDAQRRRGVIAASSGNHGAALAYAMRELGINGQIFVPEQTSRTKLEAIRACGGEVLFFGRDGLDTEMHARERAEREGKYYVSPYNDEAVITGQATCGHEIVRQLADVEAAFVAVGGGGLLSGVGSVLKHHNPHLRLFACQPCASAVMAKSVEAGRILELPSEPTLSDGTAGGVEAGSRTFELCRTLADEWVLVSEEQIASAMRTWEAAGQPRIEGAAGVALAALLARKHRVRRRNVVVIICGGNIDEPTRARVLAGHDSTTP